MTTLRQRHQIYLPDDLSSALNSLGGKCGSSKSAVVATALRAWLENRAGDALDDRFAVRIDRIGRVQERDGQKVDYISEALGTFVQHHLTLVAHHPAFTPETVHLGQQRYRVFVEAVGRRLARAGGALPAASVPDVAEPTTEHED